MTNKNRKTSASKNEINLIIEQKEKGISSRKICRKLNWNESRKSTVNNIYNKYLKGELKRTDELQDFEIEKEQLDTLCDSKDFNVSNLAKRLRTAQRTNNQLRKIQRDLFDGDGEEIPSLDKILKDLTGKLESKPTKVLNYKPTDAATPATLEVMISDIQISKLTRHYNTQTCLKAMEQYGKDLLQEITDKSGKFKVEKIILELLGDLVEDNEKHGIQSAISTDTGMSEQVVLVTEALWDHVLSPLAELGVEIEVVCIVGNHGSSTRKGMGTFKEGKYSFDYIIFKGLEKFCRIAGYDKVVFNIPEGTFGYTDIYGRKVILEHGYSNNPSEKGMIDQMRKRGAQLKVHPTYWRQGDKHHHICYGNGDQICNAAWFGVDTEGLEYSGILGFSSVPCQTLVWHTDEKSEGKSTVKDIVNIQVFVEE